MKDKITIAIDAMGGENSPDKNIQGLSYFLKKNKTVPLEVIIMFLFLFKNQKKSSKNSKKKNQRRKHLSQIKKQNFQTMPTSKAV